MKKNEKEKRIEKIICIAWSSLESHLPYTYIKTKEGKNFHKKCVKEYIEIIIQASKFL